MAVVGEATIKLNYDGKSAKVQAEKIAGEQTSILSKIGAGAKTAGKGIAAGIGAGLIATGAVIGKVASTAMGQYKEFEQLQGGIETLYGKSADTMMKNAEQAYKTAGMSANKYMETATNFAASLVQSLGGDTAKAANYADRAIQDMSDNANKMGTDIESIQNAYQGFAKQNYTMLDNLKLGYGGTKKEMERLLADAEKLSGKKFDISSYADITEAIHIVQQEMGITGTTAKEAGTTIEGSLNSAKAAWQNLIGDLAKPSADIGKSVDNLVTSLFGDGTDKNLGLFGNALPAVERAITGIAKALPNLVKKIAAKLPKLLKEIIPPLMEATVQVFVAIADSLPALMPLIVDGLVDLVVALVPHIPTILGALLAAIVQAVVALLASIGDLLAPWLASIAEGLWKWFDGIKERFAKLGAIISAFIEGVKEGFRNVMEQIGNFFASIAEKIVNFFRPVIDFFRNVGILIIAILARAAEAIYNTFIQPVIQRIQEAWNAITAILSSVAGWVNDNVIQPVANFLSGFWNGVTSTIQSFVDKVKEVVGQIGGAIAGAFQAAKDWIYGNFIKPVADFFKGLWNGVQTGLNAMAETIKNIMLAIGNMIKAPINAIIDAINGVIDGINSITVPDWVPVLGGKHAEFGHIPRLAEGGVTRRSTLANIGEQGSEAVIPLEQNTENWARPLAQAIAEQFQAQNLVGAGITVYMTNNINNNLDADEIGQRLMTSIRRAA